MPDALDEKCLAWLEGAAQSVRRVVVDQSLTPEQGWLVNAIATEGYWIVKALSNLILQGYSPFRGSPVTWDQLIAGLYGGYCANFGCAGIRQ